MQLWPVSFKTTGTDTFVNYNTDTRTLGQGVETCLYPFLNSPKSDTQRLGNYGSLYYLLLSIKTMLLFFCYLTTPNKTCSSILQIWKQATFPVWYCEIVSEALKQEWTECLFSLMETRCEVWELGLQPQSSACEVTCSTNILQQSLRYIIYWCTAKITIFI